jgi:Flp pilus assembly protein TadG
MTAGARSRRRDRGAADALGLVLIAPAMIGLALLVVALGRRVDSQAQSRSAAEFAAQAAVLERTPAAAVAAAERTAAAMLTDPDTCGSPSVIVDTADFRPGGSVTVTVNCTASSRALGAVQSEGRQVGSTAVAYIDQFRAAEAAP